jgi:hypothetical protein
MSFSKLIFGERRRFAACFKEPGGLHDRFIASQKEFLNGDDAVVPS